MILETVNLCKSFGEKDVLKNINIVAESGKALGLLGRNGAGKTTTIRIIMEVFPQDSGEILLDGKVINKDNIKIGYLPEERGLYPKKKVIEQLIYFGQLKGMKSKDAKKSALSLLERLNITEYRDKRLDTLSKGNQQKVQLVATLISNPNIVILDEPFSGLDPVNAMILKDVVKELIAKGKIVIFSSHQMNYVEEFCDQIAILNSGEIVVSGNIKDIKRSYKRDKIIVSSTDIDKIKGYIDENLIHIVKSTELKESSLIIEMKDEKNKKELIREISNNEFDIDSISVYEPSLNDIFVEYTEGRI